MLDSYPVFLKLPAGRRKCLQRSGQLVGAALFAAILVACGGSDGGGNGGSVGGGTGGEVQLDPLVVFKQQTLNWQACDPAAMDDSSNIVILGARAQCALMRVPLDYANPASGELQIEIVKVEAEQALQKLGAIVFNPGGPGDDGLTVAPSLSVQLAYGSGESAPLLKEMSRRFDLVGFAPRGTGSHSPLDCALLWKPAPMTSVHFDASLENLRNIQQNARLFAESCAANPLTKHIHTEATARDMDLLRGLLGEEKLNYIGYSYGSMLGTWYSGLFPERVGRMLLDSVMDVTRSSIDALVLDASGRQRLIDEVLLPYAASKPGQFGLGTDASALRNRLLALSTPMKKALTKTWDPDQPRELDRNIFAMAAALGLQGVLTQKPQASLDELKAEIATSPAFANAQVAKQARSLFAALFDTDDEDEVDEDYKAESVYWSVVCNDGGMHATNDNEQYWNALAQDFSARYPLVPEFISFNPCIYWSKSDKKMPAVTQVNKAGPLLMLQSRYDPSTPVEGAQETLAALENTHMIVIENEFKHSIFPYGTACVDGQIANYFLHGQLPERLSSCAGKGLGTNVNDEDEDA